MDQKTVVIKKYENRRLYDTTNSRYVNLEEVAQLVQSGKDVQVVDAATGEDLTRLVLTQIIVEDAKTPNSNFPLDVLRQMVVASGRASQESTLKYMKAVFDMYQSAYRALPSALNPFGLMPNLHPVMPQSPPDAAAPSPSPAPEPRSSGAPEAGGDSEVKELKRRIDELEGLVSRLGSAPSAGKRKTKPRRS
jgi:polyhydroxyalkanoate synthesis repressor PhaR